ncbi:MAG: hypothetical protein HZB12_03770 [Candidatus Yonathbacteria bacterium]|nr:hypothetical protein [Candidatus Yonathbacteria bacterium]
MFKKDWIKEIKKLLLLKGNDPMKMETAPFRDWRVIATTFFAGLALSVGFNVYMSIEINRDSFFVAPQKNGEAVILDKEGLAKVLAGFAEKEALFEKARTEGVPTVDPSL